MIEASVNCTFEWTTGEDDCMAEQLKREHALGIRIFADYLEQRAADLKRDKTKNEVAWRLQSIADQYRAYGETPPTASARVAITSYLKCIAAVVHRSFSDVVEGMRIGHSAAYCNACGNPYLPHSESHGQCSTCHHDHETGHYAPPAPQPPLSDCCGADVFEERGRTICEKCRTGCGLR